MEYNQCNILAKLKRKKEPLINKVSVNNFTEIVSKNFDYEFDGINKFFPYEKPILPENFKICCIVGASGSGKSLMLSEFLDTYSYSNKIFNDDSIISNFNTPEEGVNRLTSVGLNSLPIWCRQRKVLSTGEGFRADMALNLNNYMMFDEFTSTIDRNVAKSTCNGIKNFVNNNNLHHIIFSSCHKDFIPYLQPDIVIDLDDEKIYDCRDVDLKKILSCASTNPIPKMCGTYLGSITI